MRALFLTLCLAVLGACNASGTSDPTPATLGLPLTLGSVTSLSGERVIVVWHEDALCFSSPTDLVCLSDVQLATALASKRISP